MNQKSDKSDEEKDLNIQSSDSSGENLLDFILASSDREFININPVSSTDEGGIRASVYKPHLPNISISLDRGEAKFTKELLESPVTQNAKEYLQKYENRDLANQMRQVVNRIDRLLSEYRGVEIPPVIVTPSGENSLGLSWNIGDATLGVGIESNPKNSHWFLLMGSKERAVKAEGYLYEFDNDLLFNWLYYLLEKIHIRQGDIDDREISR